MISGWVKGEIKDVNFGDQRLNKRFGNLLEAFASCPAQSIPNACKTWGETLAAYRFFNNESVTPDKILSPHIKATLERIEQEKVVLIIQDTSEIDFSDRQPIKGMGKLRTENQQGFYLHPSLAVTPEKLCLGMVDGKMFCRETLGSCRARKRTPMVGKESYRWLEGYEIADRIAQSCESTLVVNVADREADIYELLMQQTHTPGKAHWIIRSQYNRNILGKEGDQQKLKLHDQIKNAPVLAEIEFVLPKAAGRADKKSPWKRIPARKERKVKQEVRMIHVDLVPANGKKLPGISIHAVHCVEIDPPDEDEKIEWILLTSIPVNDAEKAVEIVEWYMCRWQIEVFFKVLKSGCRIEELQFDSFANTANCIALYMIVAWRVLYLMMLGRQCPEISCNIVFEDSEWQSTYAMATRKRPPKEPPALHQIIRMIGNLGGFLGRKNDGEPGPKAIWTGLQRMRDFALAWETFESLKGGICV